MHETKYTADLYLRLSKEDGDKEESDSIGNQRALLLDFMKSNPEIHLNKIRIDDGYSGVDFNRPSFIEMIDDVHTGIVNCIIVKDFSRFGRDYIQSGKYIQVLFPRTGVRFIAVNDAYDSAKVQGSVNNIIVPFKNMLNDSYSADISTKVRSHLNLKRRRGDFVGSFAVYGYAKSTANKNRLVIDEFAADVVRDMFKWKLEGLSAQGIADKLNNSGILSPMEYKKSIGLRYNTTFKVNATAKWQSATVKRVLTNAVYTGVLEQGKRTKPNYKIRKCAEVPKAQWICNEDAHDQIIPRDVFDTVQELLKRDTRAVKSGENVAPLSGIIVCGDCGGAMVRKSYKRKDGHSDSYYVCGRHRADKNVCSTHTISVSACERAVFDALRLHTQAVIDVEKAISNAENMAYTRESVRKLTARLEAKQAEISRCYNLRLSLHESYSDRVITLEDFQQFKASYDKQITDAETAVALLREEIERTAAGEAENHNWIEKFRANIFNDKLERKSVAELISRVMVYEQSRIDVEIRYFNEFERLADAVRAVA